MPNFERLNMLADYLDTLPDERVQMNKLVVIDRDGETVAEALRPTCNTAGCIAGYGWLLFSSPDVVLTKTPYYDPRIDFSNMQSWESMYASAAALLGLGLEEAAYVFYGGWHPLAPPVSAYDDDWSDYCPTSHLASIRRSEVIAYLREAVDKHDVFVRLP